VKIKKLATGAQTVTAAPHPSSSHTLTLLFALLTFPFQVRIMPRLLLQFVLLWVPKPFGVCLFVCRGEFTGEILTT
jgi:hypothetical protein